MSNKYPCVYYDHSKCQKFSDDQYTAWCDFDQCEYQTPSNGDRIRAMSDEELAKFLCSHTECGGCVFGSFGGCTVTDWLKQPYKEDA